MTRKRLLGIGFLLPDPFRQNVFMKIKIPGRLGD